MRILKIIAAIVLWVGVIFAVGHDKGYYKNNKDWLEWADCAVYLDNMEGEQGRNISFRSPSGEYKYFYIMKIDFEKFKGIWHNHKEERSFALSITFNKED